MAEVTAAPFGSLTKQRRVPEMRCALAVRESRVTSVIANKGAMHLLEILVPAVCLVSEIALIRSSWWWARRFREGAPVHTRARIHPRLGSEVRLGLVTSF